LLQAFFVGLLDLITNVAFHLFAYSMHVISSYEVFF
jgi:hypothetical protein